MEINLELHTKSGELKPQHNHPGEPITRDNVLEFDPNEYTLVNVRMETVQYGLFDTKPAALIILRFIVKFRSGYKRIRNFHINIEFSKDSASAAANTMPHPKVMKLAPEERIGKIFTEERSNTVTAGVEIPLSPSGTKVHVDHELARKVNREYELRLSGWKRSSETATDNVVVWDCDEARTAARGVVRGYRGAVIIQHPENQRFRAEFKLNAERGTFNFDSKVFDWFNVFGKKQTDDPVIFDPAEPIGQQYPNLPNFKDLNLDDYIELEPIPSMPQGYS